MKLETPASAIIRRIRSDLTVIELDILDCSCNETVKHICERLTRVEDMTHNLRAAIYVLTAPR